MAAAKPSTPTTPSAPSPNPSRSSAALNLAMDWAQFAVNSTTLVAQTAKVTWGRHRPRSTIGWMALGTAGAATASVAAIALSACLIAMAGLSVVLLLALSTFGGCRRAKSRARRWDAGVVLAAHHPRRHEYWIFPDGHLSPLHMPCRPGRIDGPRLRVDAGVRVRDVAGRHYLCGLLHLVQPASAADPYLPVRLGPLMWL